jgi:5-methylcytosine-specific restriction enzyme A
MAEKSRLDPRTRTLIDHDLLASAMEGLTEEQKVKVRKRAAWFADRFVRERDRAGRLFCDDCGFDPALKVAGTGVRPDLTVPPTLKKA